MSRHLIALETHLPPPLLAALHRLVEEANSANRGMFVTGSTMRDVIAGVQAHELDLVVEGETGKLAAAVPEGVAVHVTSAAVEQFSKPGGKPKLVPATIHEFLKARDFSVNAIALSVTRASRGLLVDPTNGAADIEARELRTLSSQAFHTRPVRMLELLRLKVRLGFTTYPRTQAQFDEALEAGVFRRIKPAEMNAELARVALEPKAFEVLEAWDAAGMLGELLPSISGEALNVHGFSKVQKARQTIPFGIDFPVDEAALFYHVLTENLGAKERAAFLESAGIAADADWLKLGRRIVKVEKELSAPGLHKPSQVYDLLSRAGPTVTLLLAHKSTQRLAQDRVRNYLTKYLPMAKEARPGENVAKLLDARPKKVAAAAGSDATSVS